MYCFTRHVSDVLNIFQTATEVNKRLQRSALATVLEQPGKGQGKLKLSIVNF